MSKRLQTSPGALGWDNGQAGPQWHAPLFDLGGMGYNVRNSKYGANGGGMVSDSNAFTLAANDAHFAPGGAGMVIVPPGTYLIDVALPVYSNVTYYLVGATITGAQAATVAPALNFDSGGNLVAKSLTVLASGPYTPVGKAGGAYFSGSPWFDVIANGAKGDGVTDDTTAVQNTLNLVPAGGGTVYFPQGTYLISAFLTPKTNTIILGSGRNTSIIKGTAGFVAGTNNNGLIEFIGTGNTVFAFNEIRSLGFDISGVTDVQATCVHQRGATPASFGSAIQHFIADDLAFTMTPGVSHVGLQLEGLGTASGNASFDINISNLYGVNGRSTCNLYLNGASSTSTYYDVRIRNIYTVVNTTGIIDDRVAIVVNYPSGAGGNAEVHDVAVQGVYVFITSGLASGTINAVKLDCGSNGYLHSISIRDVFMYNLSTAVVATPIYFLLTGGTSQLENVLVDGVWAYQTARLQIRLVRNRQAPTCVIQNVKLVRSTDTVAGIEVYSGGNAVGDESLIIRNVSLDNNASQGAQIPVGIMLTGGSSTQGWSGMNLISGVFVNNYKNVFTNDINEAGSVALSGWSNIQYENFAYNAVSAVFHIGAGTVYSTKYHQGSGAEVFDSTQAIQIGNSLSTGVTLGGAGAPVTTAGHVINSVGSGAPATTNLGANVTSVTFTGNDRRGTIAIVMSAGLARATRIATCTFGISYGATAPQVFFFNQTSGNLALVNLYRLAFSTGVSFDIASDQALVAGTYTFGYIVEG